MYSGFNGEAIGASPEVAREMTIAARNKRLSYFMNEAFFNSKVQPLRSALIEHRQHLITGYQGATGNDCRNIFFVLLHSTDELLKLLPVERLPVMEWPSDTMKKKVGGGICIALTPGEKDARCDGIHSAYIMENNFNGDGAKEIVERNP